MSLSIFHYIGSKRLDLKFFEKYIPDPQKIDFCVEPFGGSGYTSLYLFSKNNNIKSIVNDLDPKLINFFNEIKRDEDAVINGVNKMISERPNKEEYEVLKKEYKEDKGDNLRKAILYLFLKKYHGIREFLHPAEKVINILKKEKFETFFKWVKNTEYNLKDFKETMEDLKKYKNKRLFVFFDPPYFESFNSDYSNFKAHKEDNNIIDNTQIYIDILDYLKSCKRNTMLIINKNAITKYIYSKYILGDYKKTYQYTKSNTEHLIIGNYKL
jgi:site-specific DNA-adenine methylase